MIILTIHKLIALATLVFLIVIVVRVNKAIGLNSIQWVSTTIAGLLFIATIASGGLLSTGKSMPAAILWLHRVAPYLTLLATVASMYLLIVR